MASLPTSGVVFVAGNQAPGTALEAFLTKTQLPVSSLSFACVSECATAPASTHQVALLACSPEAPVSSQALSSIARCLKPGAQLYLFPQEAAQIEQLQKELVLGGFLEVKVEQAPSHVMVTASKPAWEVGAKAALALKRPTAQPAVAQAWKLDTAGEDELMDEDELLTEEDKKAGASAVPASDCSTSKKACKNCSCGRAEAEAAGEKVELTQEMLDNPKTNCGSCALGDAFRCAGCPYRGLPAFEPGKKITLGSDFLTADA